MNKRTARNIRKRTMANTMEAIAEYGVAKIQEAFTKVGARPPRAVTRAGRQPHEPVEFAKPGEDIVTFNARVSRESAEAIAGVKEDRIREAYGGGVRTGRFQSSKPNLSAEPRVKPQGVPELEFDKAHDAALIGDLKLSQLRELGAFNKIPRARRKNKGQLIPELQSLGADLKVPEGFLDG